MPGDPSATPSTSPGLPGESGDGKSSEGSSNGSSESSSKDGESSKDGKSGSASPDGAGGGAQTSDERRKSGEKALDDSLGDFDKTLKKEQERVAKERDAKGTAEGEGSEGGGSDGADTSGANGAPGTRNGDLKSASSSSSSASKDGSADGSSDKGDAAGDTQGKASKGSGAGHQKAVTGSDDDIVAKRLRKAAEEETDPELKDRLWKEYYDYKKAAG
jgi:hypothetical protein